MPLSDEWLKHRFVPAHRAWLSQGPRQ